MDKLQLSCEIPHTYAQALTNIAGRRRCSSYLCPSLRCTENMMHVCVGKGVELQEGDGRTSVRGAFGVRQGDGGREAEQCVEG